MARRTRRPTSTAEQTLAPVATTCVACGHRRHLDSANGRTNTTLSGVTRYTLRIGRGRPAPCDPVTVPFRPEAEGRLALPRHEVGLAAVAGNRRYTAHRTAPGIHAERIARGVALSVRTATNLPHRFDERRPLAAGDPARLQPLRATQGRGCRPSIGCRRTSGTRGCGSSATV